MGKKTANYGSWVSPITSDSLTGGNSRGLERGAELQLDHSSKGKGKIYWLEVRFSEKGRGVICSADQKGVVTEWTPPNFAVGTKVHEYGGGSFLVHEGVVYFSNFSDQRIYRQSAPEEEPQPLTPKNKGWRYADGFFANNSIYCVLEDHDVITEHNAVEAKNCIAKVCSTSGTVTVIVEGKDFYASPRVNSEGTMLTWVQWTHPNMPWDSTEICTLELDNNGNPKGSPETVLSDGKTSYLMPQFHPSGKLFCCGDKSDWWNLYEVDLAGKKEKRNLFPQEKEIGEPHWVFGIQAYSFQPGCGDGSKNVAFYSAGELYLGNTESGTSTKLETGYAGHNKILFGTDNIVYCFASHPSKPAVILAYHISDSSVKVVRTSADSTLDVGYISIPTEIRFPTGKDNTAHAYGYYYTPTNTDFVAPEGTLPPLLVMAHGGPTARAGSGFDLKKQYWTSRGFAVLDVNYRGSTGHGRQFRDALKGQCGVVDIEDCCNGARYLVREKLVDGSKLCISGGSAGGYVVLRAISVPNLFSASVSRYGISDLVALQLDTHKFEAQYNFTLIAPYPQQIDVFKHRSPINHLDDICCPVGFFQGLDDKIVPPNQTKAMYDAVKAKGFPTMLVQFEGEGHGFRKADNIKLSIDGEYFYFCKVLGIEPTVHVSDDLMTIVNLPK